MLTPELLGIVDKAMRDVLRMEIGAEFFTFPQGYILGADENIFSAPPGPGHPTVLAISRDVNGDVPQVGQFSPTDAGNFTMTFENDAQRFSGAANVPLAQRSVREV